MANTGALVREKFFKKEKSQEENHRESIAEADTASLDSAAGTNAAKKKGGFFKNAFSAKKVFPQPGTRAQGGTDGDQPVSPTGRDIPPVVEPGMTMEQKGKLFFGKQFRL